MNMTRRHLAAAGALALGTAELLRQTPTAAAAGGAEAAALKAVEALRQALLKADKAQLQALCAAGLSYGHSDGRVQTKAEFIDGVMTRKAIVKSIDFPEAKVWMAGNNAIARHLYVSESELDGKTNNVKIGVLAVWTRESGGWKLLARQGYKLG